MRGMRWIMIMACGIGAATGAGGATLAPKALPLTAGGRDVIIPYQGSHSLEVQQAVVKRVVIAVHGADYSAQGAYNAVIIASGGHAGASDPVCLIAPQFLRSSELPASIPENLLYWNNFPFRGTSSARIGPSASQVTISVFDVLDRLLEAVSDPGLFPNLETVVVAGFSAGGQTVNRYALVGRFEGALPRERSFHLRYMVLSPSSYAYITPERDPDGDGLFTLPEAGCAGYDDWGYGLQSLYTYPSETGSAAILEQYPKRFVFYLVGGNDNNPNDSSLATDCASMLQGPHRVARARTYFNHLLETFGPEIRHYQSFHIVPGAGHSFSQTLNSTAGRRFLFDRDETDTDGDGLTDWAEWILGSDAEDGSDTFVPAWDPSPAPGSQGLSWKGLPDRHYTIQQSAEPGSAFSPLDNIPPLMETDTLNWPVVPDDGAQFLRVESRLR